MKKASLLIASLALLCSTAFGLDLKEGRMRLVINERSGRFALYYLADVAKNQYVPLLYDQETRTTYATLMVDDKPYKLGDASEFRVSVAKEPDGGARVEYRSSFCVVKQTFSFIASPGAAMRDGVSIGFSIENVSQKDATIGLRFLMDTWLGEKASAHFWARSTGPLSGEAVLSGDSGDPWIRSVEAVSGSEANLQVQLTAPAATPDRLVVANWKRLNDAAWSFDASTSRNFTLLPYSINDSAAALFYEPLAVRPGSTRDIGVILSQANDGYPAVAAKAVSPAVSAITSPELTAPLDEMADLIAVRSVIEAVDAALASGSVPSAEDMAAIESTLRRLETRKAKY